MLCSLEHLGKRFDRGLQQLCYSLSRLLCRKSERLENGKSIIDYGLFVQRVSSHYECDGHRALDSSATSSLRPVDRKHFICLVEFTQTNRGRAVVAKAATSGDMAPWRVLCDGQWRVSIRRFLRLLLYRTATDIYQKNLNSTEESFALWANFFINTFHSCVYKLGEWTSIQLLFVLSVLKSWKIIG